MSLCLSRKSQAIVGRFYVLIQKALKPCCTHSETVEFSKPGDEMNSGLFHGASSGCGTIEDLSCLCSSMFSG